MSRTLTVYFGEPATETLKLELATDDWNEATESAVSLGCVLWGTAEGITSGVRGIRCCAEKASATEEWISIS